MNVKESVLELFENNIGNPLSGASIAKDLGVSRNAVWKAVKALCDEGYNISSAGNKGYTMESEEDILSKASIIKYINNPDVFDIDVVKSITSTNTVLKEEANNGAPQGRVIVASEQTQGKGRLGRSFYSPAQSGIYMSIVLRPTMSANESLFITTAAAVAVAKAIEDVAPVKAKIKWVNDIFVEDKKVSGILTEASINVESGKLDWAVLGIGINISNPDNDFPDDIKEIASSLYGKENYSGQVKSKLAACVLNYFWEYYTNIDNRIFMKEYKERSLIIGKPILIVEKGTNVGATAIDIDDNAGLIVKLEDGTVRTLSSGEISIRPILD